MNLYSSMKSSCTFSEQKLQLDYDRAREIMNLAYNVWKRGYGRTVEQLDWDPSLEVPKRTFEGMAGECIYRRERGWDQRDEGRVEDG